MNGLILGFVSDIMFQTRIESTAERLGAKVYWASTTDQVFDLDIDTPLFEESAVLDHISNMEPNLLIFDLGNNSIPWTDWIPLLKNHPKTEEIPVVCFGSHVNTEVFVKARKTGADEVLARSRFVTVLPSLIRKYVFPD
ncbi:MAG: hypothetical protein ACK2U1_22470 [Anaerolineales bacterium]